MSWSYLALLALAAARAVHLIADDRVPFGYLRTWIGKPAYSVRAGGPTLGDRVRLWLEDGLSCTFCLSIWAGAGAAALAQWQGWAPDGFWLYLVLWFSFAEAIVLIEGLVFRLMGED